VGRSQRRRSIAGPAGGARTDTAERSDRVVARWLVDIARGRSRPAPRVRPVSARCQCEAQERGGCRHGACGRMARALRLTGIVPAALRRCDVPRRGCSLGSPLRQGPSAAVA
jgi:hypothetical protein